MASFDALSLSLFSGRKISVSDFMTPKPKIQLSDAYGGTPEFKQEMNAWLLERFGREEEQIIISTEGIHVSPQVYQQLMSMGVVK